MSLRRQALRGGRYLIMREGMGILVRTSGMLLLTRLIGPENYGLFAGPYFVVQFAAALAMSGADVFLLRRHGEVEQAWYHQVFSYLLVSATVVAVIGVLTADLYAAIVQDPRVRAPLQVLMLSIPLNILWTPAKARLERSFRYRRLAISEVGADVCQYTVALGLAAGGAGLWAAVYGFLARQAFMLASSFLLARYRPRWHWNRAMVRELLGFGGPYTGSAVAGWATHLVIPLVVGRYLGASAVGVAALTVRLAETASFINRATNRLSIVALGKVQRDLPRLRTAVEETTALQVLTVGPVLVASVVLGSLVLPALLGQRWNDVVELLPFIAVNHLLVAALTTQNVALMVLGRQGTLLISNVVRLLLQVAAAFVLVPLIGLPGYGLAQTVSISATWIKNLELRRIAGVRYRRALPWLIAMVPLLFVPLLPWWAVLLCLLPLLAVLVLRGPRAELRGYARMLRQVGSRATTAPPASV